MRKPDPCPAGAISRLRSIKCINDRRNIPEKNEAGRTGQETTSSSECGIEASVHHESVGGWLSQADRHPTEIPVEIVPPTFRRVPDPDGDCHGGAPARLHRLFRQAHVGLFRRPVRFSDCYNASTPSRCFPRSCVHLSQWAPHGRRSVPPCGTVPAVLAAIPVAGENIDARELHCAMAVLQLDQLQEPHHRRQFDRDRDTVDLAVVDFEDFDLPPPEQGNGLCQCRTRSGS